MKKILLFCLVLFAACTKNEVCDCPDQIIPDTTKHTVLFESYSTEPSFYRKWDVIVNCGDDSLYFNQISDFAYQTKAYQFDTCIMTMDSIHAWGYYRMRITINDSVYKDSLFESPLHFGEKVKLFCIIK